MDATISVICYKSKTLANGEHLLMLRFEQNGKSTYKSLKISIPAKHWDFERNVPKPNNRQTYRTFQSFKCSHYKKVSWIKTGRTFEYIRLS